MDKIQEFVAPHYDWFHGEVVPPVVEFWYRLNVPTWDIYSEAARTCGKDFVQSSQSTLKLLYLTFRPIAILSWIVFQVLLGVGKILFRHLLEKGWISLQKGALQVKAASIWFYQFQRSLSRTEVLGELGIIALCVLLYYLRQWLKRQTYVARATKWCQAKHRHMVKVYTNTLHKVAQVSLLFAMTLPHLIFIGAGVGLRILFPSLVKWLAYDTFATSILSVWYPLVYTLGWIHQDRYQQEPKQKEDDVPTSKRTAAKSPAGKKSVKEISGKFEKGTSKRQKGGPSYLKSTASQRAREGFAKERASPLSSRVFPKTSPPKKTKDTQAAENPPAAVAATAPQMSGTKYWIRYWVFFALIQAFGNVCNIVPVFGRFVARHPIILSAAAELKLFFFVWMFGMEKVLGSSAEDALLSQAVPMRLLNRHVTPILLEFDAIISEAVSKEQWQSVVHSKAQRVLEVFVMVRFISEPFKDWLLHVIDEGRVLILPSVTLLMPGFVTQFGVAYVQFVVPSAKSARVNSESARVLYLQYWVLHCVLSGFLTWFSSLLWWIPFSTHLIFLAWCNLSFPKTISEYYAILEMELVAFGLIKGDSKLDFHETRTVRLLSAVAKALPSAADTDETDGAAIETVDSSVAPVETKETAAAKVAASMSEDTQDGEIDAQVSEDTQDSVVNAHLSEDTQEVQNGTVNAIAMEGSGEDIEVVVPEETERVFIDKETQQSSPVDDESGEASSEQPKPITSQDDSAEEPVQPDNDEDVAADLSIKKPASDEDGSYPDLGAKTLPTYESDSSASSNNGEVHDDSKGEKSLRRSTRSRKPVQYNE